MSQTNTATQPQGADERGPVYWFMRHMFDGALGFARRHRLAAGILAFIAVALALLFREEWQPAVMVMRRYFVPVLIGLGVVAFALFAARRAAWWKRLIAFLLAATVVAGAGAVYEYVALWARYQALRVEELARLPETTGERVQALASVHGLAQGITSDSRSPTLPAYIRVVGKDGKPEYRWSMSVEPAYSWDRLIGSIDEVLLVSGTDPSPDFSSGTCKVRFMVGESLLLSSDAETAAIRSLDPLRFFNYEPAGVRYVPDDSGEIVEVISLIRWEGFLFPYPEFGGVLIVRQEPEPSILRYVDRVFRGAGSWIPPEDIAKYPYLRGQNLKPDKISEYIGESMRFMNGFFAPLPGYHQGDVRMPKLPGETNGMPYALPFAALGELPEMMYHYIALEPYLEGKHGLVASVLVPADGTDRVFVYHHERRGENLIGVSMVAGIVRDSRKTYNTNFAPIEHRPFIRHTGGKTEFAWLTTVVTYSESTVKAKDTPADAAEKQKDERRTVVTGSIPEIVLTNARTNATAWVDARDHAGWANALPK